MNEKQIDNAFHEFSANPMKLHIYSFLSHHYPGLSRVFTAYFRFKMPSKPHLARPAPTFFPVIHTFYFGQNHTEE